jgi:hypothetical protein
MASALRWPMDHSLAQAREGDVLEVKEILFGGLRDHLRKIGVREGATLEHLGQDDSGVEVRLGDGRGAGDSAVSWKEWDRGCLPADYRRVHGHLHPR